MVRLSADAGCAATEEGVRPPAASPQPNIGRAALWRLRLHFWLLTPLTGVAAGVSAGLLMWLLRSVQGLAWTKTAGQSFLDAVQATTLAHRFAVLAGAGVLAAFTRGALRRATGGHGGEITEKIWYEAGSIPVFRTTAQAVASIVLVALGASLGREAAPKQMGAAFGGWLAGKAGVSRSHRRLLAALGAGAGIAAVYNVPFGGAIFALEVLLGTLSLPLVPPALIVTATATATAWLFLPNAPTYHVAFFPASLSLIVWAALFGPLAGLVAGAYTKLIIAADALKPKRRVESLLAPVVVFMGLGALATPLPQVLGNGKDVAQLAFEGGLGLGLLLAIVVLKPLATAACLGSGAPGGLFTPTITLGAVFGALLGVGWTRIWPDAPAGAYAIVGAAAVLAAATNGPVSAIVLTLELTRRFDSLMAPVMIAVGGAVVVARLIESRSIYSGRVHARERPPQGPRLAISAAARYSELVRMLLKASSQEPILVFDKNGEPMGVADAGRAGDPSPSEGPLETATAGDFVTQAERTPEFSQGSTRR